MKFNKKNMYSVRDYDKKLFINYLDGSFAYTQIYPKTNKKDAEKSFIAEVKFALKSYDEMQENDIQVKRTYKGDGSTDIISLAEALKYISGSVLSISLAKECLLLGMTHQTNFNYFDVIKEQYNEKTKK